MSNLEWMALESKITELIKLCDSLSEENKAMRAQLENWTKERARLIEKNELAKNRVETMIGRLKTLNQD